MKRSSLLLTFLFNCSILVGQVGIISTVAGGGTATPEGVAASSAMLSPMSGLQFDLIGNYFFCQGYQVKKVSVSGLITTFAGTPSGGFGGDGGQATAASFGGPTLLTFDKHDKHLYVCDPSNYRLRKIEMATGVVTTVVGTGSRGYSGDGGLATNARIDEFLGGVAIDSFGNIYFPGYRRIRKIDTYGIVTTYCGDGTLSSGFTESGIGGLASAAKINSPSFLHIRNGYLYFFSNSIRRINLGTGVLTAYAGDTATSGRYPTGDGGPATAACLGGLDGLSSDEFGNIYLSSGSFDVVRVVNRAGIINTVAGGNFRGFSGDGGPATAAQLNSPRQIDIDSCGNIYICDNGNLRIRKVTFPTCHALDVPQVQAEVVAGSITISPNPVGDELNVSIALPLRAMRVIDVNGRILQELPIEGRERITINAHGLAPGLYFLEAIGTNSTTIHQRFVKE